MGAEPGQGGLSIISMTDFSLRRARLSFSVASIEALDSGRHRDTSDLDRAFAVVSTASPK